MIQQGTLVARLDDDFLTHLNRAVLRSAYPPVGALCIVVSSPKECDLTKQLKVQMDGHISLKKAIDVLHEGKVYHSCEVRAFKEVKVDR